MTRPLGLKDSAGRTPPSRDAEPTGKSGDTPPLFSRLRRQLQRARARSGGEGQGAAPVLAAIAEMIDAEAAAIAVERDGALAIRDLTLDARHRDSRTKIAAELRLAASEALRGKGSYQEMSTALEGAVVLASAFADRSGAVVALRRGGTAAQHARATLELAAVALEPTASDGGRKLATKLSALLAAFEGAAPADPVELAELMASAFGASNAFVGSDDGAIRAIFPAGAARGDSPVESAARDLLIRAGSAAGPIVEQGKESPDTLTSVLKVKSGRNRKAAPVICLLADPHAAFKQLDAQEWTIVQTLLDGAIDAPRRSRAGAGRRWAGRIGAIAAALLAAAVMFVPIPDRIRAKAELELEGRRFVTATFNAVLQHSGVAPGDTVTRGQPIAELEGEELVLSHSVAVARADEAFRRRDAAVREKNVTEAELARLEGEAAAAERDLLARQIAQLRLRSPVWDERIGASRVQARNWRLMAFGCLALSVGLSGGLLWQSLQSRVTPYVVEVDKFGEARAVAPAIQNYQPADAQIAWHLARFITKVRSVSTDPVLVRQNWLSAYDFATDRAALFLNGHAKKNDPFSAIGTRSVSVQVTSVVRASDSSFQVKWTEQVFERGSLARTERWTASLTVVIQTPRTADQLRKNPLGVFVNAIDWSRELDAAAPSLPKESVE